MLSYSISNTQFELPSYRNYCLIVYIAMNVQVKISSMLTFLIIRMPRGSKMVFLDRTDYYHRRRGGGIQDVTQVRDETGTGTGLSRSDRTGPAGLPVRPVDRQLARLKFILEPLLSPDKDNRCRELETKAVYI